MPRVPAKERVKAKRRVKAKGRIKTDYNPTNYPKLPKAPANIPPGLF